MYKSEKQKWNEMIEENSQLSKKNERLIKRGIVLETKIAKLNIELNEATRDSFQNLNR